MDPPPPSTTPPPLTTSSPRATRRASESLRLMCSYGGHIVPRPHDKSLCYVGGDTKIIAVDRRSTSLSDLTSRLSRTFFNHQRGTISFAIKYQLPNEDLDSLISVSTDEDFENLIDEYDRVCATSGRLRLFLFPNKYDSGSSSTVEVGSIFDSMRSEDWFLSGVLKGVFSDAQSMNCLIGSINGMASNSNNTNNDINSNNLGSREFDAEFSTGKNAKQGGGGQYEQSAVPDSPIVGTNSSFGSTSSAHALANLPPIRVHVEDVSVTGAGIRVPDQKLGIEEQFAQINISAAQNQNQYEGFAGLSSPPMPTSILVSTPTSAIPVSPTAAAGGAEHQNRVFYDDERLEQVIPVVAYGRLPQAQPQAVLQTMPLQPQQKVTGGVELPSPDSVSSDSSLTNPTYRQSPMIYHDQVAQPPMNMTDPNPRIPIQQQVPESGYVMQPHLEQRQQQQQVPESGYVMQPHLDQRKQQQQQIPEAGYVLQPNLEQRQQQQIIHPSAQYIHQHHPSRPMPISSYYPGYPSQQYHQQQPMYFMNPRPQQPYNLSLQQPNFSEPLPTNPLPIPQTPNPAMLNTPTAYGTVQNAPPSKTDLTGGVYRAAAGPQLVHVSPNQHQQQFVSYSQVPHPSQSMAPSSGVTPNYAYGYADPTHAQAQIYYTQTQSPYVQPLPGQYQTMTTAAAVGLPEPSSQPNAEK